MPTIFSSLLILKFFFLKVCLILWIQRILRRTASTHCSIISNAIWTLSAIYPTLTCTPGYSRPKVCFSYLFIFKISIAYKLFVSINQAKRLKSMEEDKSKFEADFYETSHMPSQNNFQFQQNCLPPEAPLNQLHMFNYAEQSHADCHFYSNNLNAQTNSFFLPSFHTFLEWNY